MYELEEARETIGSSKFVSLQLVRHVCALLLFSSAVAVSWLSECETPSKDAVFDEGGC